uniref:FCP1 homology domain-containing protein n=1 Tax=Otolemur garnettii TaxID=30611 RepID=H0XSI7_OTOGA
DVDNNLITSTPRAGEKLNKCLEMINQYIKQNVKLEDPCSGSFPRSTLLGTVFSLLFSTLFALGNKNNSGSDSSGWAVEAEEKVKQLDIEQVDEITPDTTTPTSGGPFSSQAVQMRLSINNGLEETKETVHCNIPPFVQVIPGSDNLSAHAEAIYEYNWKGFDPYYLIRYIPSLTERQLNQKSAVSLKTRSIPEFSVLDLNKTLVYHNLHELEDTLLTFPVLSKITFIKLCKFLPCLSEFWKKVYADKLLNILDLKGNWLGTSFFVNIFFSVQGNQIKNMIIYNTPQAVSHQLSNGIPIERWFIDVNVNAQLESISFLKNLIELNIDI